MPFDIGPPFTARNMLHTDPSNKKARNAMATPPTAAGTLWMTKLTKNNTNATTTKHLDNIISDPPSLCPAGPRSGPSPMPPYLLSAGSPRPRTWRKHRKKCSCLLGIAAFYLPYPYRTRLVIHALFVGGGPKQAFRQIVIPFLQRHSHSEIGCDGKYRCHYLIH